MAVTVECVWCPRVWPWQFDVIVTYPRGWRCQLDVVCARVCGCGSWMWSARTYIAMIVECIWCSRV